MCCNAASQVNSFRCVSATKQQNSAQVPTRGKIINFQVNLRSFAPRETFIKVSMWPVIELWRIGSKMSGFVYILSMQPIQWSFHRIGHWHWIMYSQIRTHLPPLHQYEMIFTRNRQNRPLLTILIGSDEMCAWFKQKCQNNSDNLPFLNSFTHKPYLIRFKFKMASMLGKIVSLICMTWSKH